MPSGVSQGSAAPAAEAAAETVVKSTSVKSGTLLMTPSVDGYHESLRAPQVCSAQCRLNCSVGRFQRRQGIAAGKNEAACAGPAKCGFQPGWPAGDPHCRPGCAQSLNGRHPFLLVDRVRGAKAGELGARGPERLDHLVLRGEAVIPCC